MAFVLMRRISRFRPNPKLLQFGMFSSSKTSNFLDIDDEVFSAATRLHLSPLFSRKGENSIKDCKIEVMDDESWQVASGFRDALRGNEKGNALKMKPFYNDLEDEGNDASKKDYPDFDEIEDMRIHGKLFYKLDKDSKEYEECKFDYHRRKPAKNVKDRNENKKKEILEFEKAAKKEEQRDIKKKESESEALSERVSYEHLISHLQKDIGDRKKKRIPTFNQLTAPYHEPFCLDIYISKGSVRGSIIHRATSKVVAVAHSISKDMKFDLESTKNRSTCAAIGEVLAQRALADDIHNVVYTPRKGEKLEGKLQIVLKSIIDGGVNVKVKLKQKKHRKGSGFPPKNSR